MGSGQHVRPAAPSARTVARSRRCASTGGGAAGGVGGVSRRLRRSCVVRCAEAAEYVPSRRHARRRDHGDHPHQPAALLRVRPLPRDGSNPRASFDLPASRGGASPPERRDLPDRSGLRTRNLPRRPTHRSARSSRVGRGQDGFFRSVFAIACASRASGRAASCAASCARGGEGCAYGSAGHSRSTNHHEELSTAYSRAIGSG